jgi:hypothetical protein
MRMPRAFGAEKPSRGLNALTVIRSIEFPEAPAAKRLHFGRFTTGTRLKHLKMHLRRECRPAIHVCQSFGWTLVRSGISSHF